MAMALKTDTLRSVPKRTPTVRTALLGAALCLCLALSAATSTAVDTRPLRETELLTGLTGLLHPDGTLVFRSATSGDPALTVTLSTPGSRRARRGADTAPHLARAAEGAPGGHRGLSVDTDDDGDGLRDEDRLDGRDNDGDGRIDEDYAAISDEMIVVAPGAAAGGGHLEFYNWAYPHLRSTVFASLAAADGSTWTVTTGGSAWIDADIAMRRHTVTGRGVDVSTGAFVSQLHPDAGCTEGGGRWLGVVVLDEPGGDGVGRAHLDGRTLGVGVGQRPLAVAVCAADSWLQLVRMLTDARRIRNGVTDPVSGERVPWIASPLCAACRTRPAPGFRWRIDGEGSLVLGAQLDADHALLPDPDLVALAGLPLGSPAEIRWLPAGGGEHDLVWSCVTASQLARAGRRADPWSVLADAGGHGVSGRLELVYRNPGPAVLDRLTGGSPGVGVARAVAVRTVDGRELDLDLAADPVMADPVRSAVALASGGGGPETADSPAAQSLALRETEAPTSLAPDLLQGWPNPFRDVITIRFTVPATVGEAFHWNEATGPPAGIDLAAPVPWNSGEPDATVKVYTISGQELVTLHAGSAGPGGATVTWNGTDSFGRKVASGTYFCKLQLDDWSVTRRLVYIR